MTVTPTAAGWYPDPFRDTGERYWTGSSWTRSERPSAAPDQPLGQPVMSPSPVNARVPVVPTAEVPRLMREYRGAAPEKPGGPGFQANSVAWGTVLVSAIYGVVAWFSGFVLIGILPVVLCIQSFRRHERLAWLAAVSAGMVILITVWALVTHD